MPATDWVLTRVNPMLLEIVLNTYYLKYKCILIRIIMQSKISEEIMVFQILRNNYQQVMMGALHQ